MGGRLRRRDIAVVRPDVARKAAFGAAVGNAMEWFDFGIYSYLAVTIGKIFFPQVDPDAQLVASFATFAVAFLARPAGALFFGRLGDAIGRKSVLVITLAIMAISTFSIGLIPGYQTIGLTAALLLFLARLAQGFSTGGEYAGAMTYVVEYSPDKRRGRMASLLEVGTLTGFILGAGMVTALTAWLGPEKMLQWGWRLPFFIAAPIGLFSAWFRSRLEETPAFESLEKNPEERPSKISLKDLVRIHWRPMSIGLGLVLFYNVIDYMVLSYMPSYLSSVLGYGETKGLLLILVVMLIMIPVVFLVGAASDRWGRNPILRGALVSLLVWTIPAFLLVQNGQDTIVFAGLVLLGAHLAAFEGTMTSTLPSLFFTEVRYGALAITYNFSTSVFGGTTPLVLSLLVRQFHNRLIPAYFLMGAALIGLAVSVFVKETASRSLRGSTPVVADSGEIGDVLARPSDAVWWEEEPEAPSQRVMGGKNDMEQGVSREG
ncbi:MFS transporter [Leptospirillum ferriphilum]|jgi:MHS family proline/betaine transporter-like MFS transporter|uniref:Putative major facilitator superfamily transporter n=1 Tax=Leptospirillum sp. Group II '5-way CG' TaxID=419541 RepID=B6ALS8_9BACT|nr:MFS transporter [Leptospirillum sp. Group II 'CF-1']AKS22810.1 MFS transporter [Leptospirillum sp. Group II 'CF-1']EDZ39435.1 MAG: Putative major facilitator superfamily transporter [Leptospirillum sp. Group II '5-way CG']EIJ77004.1 MAG: Putative major facilitator superfamily transporter [Leptospirillum sp. Group II 'C75']